MSQYHSSAVQHYNSAAQLQGHTAGYLLMFETLLKQNSQGYKAYLAHDFESENQAFEKSVRILMVMKKLFQDKQTKPEIAMFDFFSTSSTQLINFSDHDDRTDYYMGLYEQINEMYKVWKN